MLISCPQCDHPLGKPLSTGRQVCTNCAWLSPRTGSPRSRDYGYELLEKLGTKEQRRERIFAVLLPTICVWFLWSILFAPSQQTSRSASSDGSPSTCVQDVMRRYKEQVFSITRNSTDPVTEKSYAEKLEPVGLEIAHKQCGES